MIPVEHQIIENRYVIIECLGEGGSGAVYKAREVGLERVVALKMLHSSFVGDSESRFRFLREGKVLSELIHPNLPLFYRFGVWQDMYPYIAMEFLTGTSLRKLVLEQSPLPLQRVLDILIQVCDAMESVHNAGIVHRDLKPDNIMLAGGTSEPELVKIIDFGLARVNSQNLTSDLTHTGVLIGSVHYMSPEQCLGRTADARSDVYAIGCILYETLVGEPPFAAENPVALIHKHVDEPVSIKRLGAREPALVNVILRSMAKKPADRYQSMRELRLDLERLRDHREQEIVPAPDADYAQYKSRARNRNVIAALVVTAILSVAVCTALRYKFVHHSKPAPPPNRDLVMRSAQTALEQAMAMATKAYVMPPSVGMPQMNEAVKIATEICRRRPPASHRGLSYQAHAALVSIYQQRLNYKQKCHIKGSNELELAEPEIAAALAYATKSDGSYERPAAYVICQLGELQMHAAKFDQARKSFEKALWVSEHGTTSEDFVVTTRIWGSAASDLGANIKECLAMCEEKDGHADKAVALYWQSYKESIGLHDGLRFNSINCLRNLARVYSNKHRTVELKRLIQLLHQRLTSDTELLNGNASFGFTALALMALDAGDRDEALFAASEAVKRVDATCKEDILGDVTTVINRLAEQSRENPQKTQLLKHLLDQLDHIRQRKEIVSDDTR